MTEFCEKHEESGWTCANGCKIDQLLSAPPTCRNSTQFVDEPASKIKGSYGGNSWNAGYYTQKRPGGFESPILDEGGHPMRMKQGTERRREIDRKVRALKAGVSLKDVQSS